MAERSVVMYALRFNKKRKPDEKISPHNIKGRGIIDIFQEWCGSMRDTPIHLASTDDWLWIEDAVAWEDGSGVLVRLKTGQSGEAGALVQTEGDADDIPFTATHATAIYARAYLHTAPRCDVSLLSIEHVVHGGGDTRLHGAFKRDFIKLCPDVTMDISAVVESRELWDKYQGVSEIEVRLIVPPKDIADDVAEDYGSISYRLHHKRGNRFSMELFHRIRKNHREAYEILLPTKDSSESLNDENSSIYVTLTDENGAERKFAVDDSPLVRIRRVLGRGSGDDGNLSDEEFVAFCVDESQRVLRSEGYIV